MSDERDLNDIMMSDAELILALGEMIVLAALLALAAFGPELFAWVIS